MTLSNYHNLVAIVREISHELVRVLRKGKRIAMAIEKRAVTAEMLLRSKLGLPDDYTIDQNGVVRDGSGEVVGNYAAELLECQQLLDAALAPAVLAAVLQNDQTFLQQRGGIGVDWLYSMEKFMADTEIGPV